MSSIMRDGLQRWFRAQPLHGSLSCSVFILYSIYSMDPTVHPSWGVGQPASSESIFNGLIHGVVHHVNHDIGTDHWSSSAANAGAGSQATWRTVRCSSQSRPLVSPDLDTESSPPKVVGLAFSIISKMDSKHPAHYFHSEKELMLMQAIEMLA